jgi:hypothetical protein
LIYCRSVPLHLLHDQWIPSSYLSYSPLNKCMSNRWSHISLLNQWSAWSIRTVYIRLGFNIPTFEPPSNAGPLPPMASRSTRWRGRIWKRSRHQRLLAPTKVHDGAVLPSHRGPWTCSAAVLWRRLSIIGMSATKNNVPLARWKKSPTIGGAGQVPYFASEALSR